MRRAWIIALLCLPLLALAQSQILVTSDEPVAGVTVTKTGVDAYTLTLASTLGGSTAGSLDIHETPAPSPTAPSVAAEGSGPLTGTYYWVVTYVTAQGETAPGYGWTATLSSQAARLSGIPTGPSEVTGRKVYRNKAGTAYPYYYVGTIADNTSITFLDSVADTALGAPCDVAGAASARLTVNGNPAMVLSPNLISVGRGNGICAQVENNVWLGNGIAPNSTAAHDDTVAGSGGAGASIISASGDTYAGAGAGHSHQYGNRNTWIGLNAGWTNQDGAYNTGLGAWAGFSGQHNKGCTFLGYQAGYYESGDSKLSINVARPDGMPQTLISGQGGATPSVTIQGTLQASNLSGINTGDQDLTPYARKDTAQDWAATQNFRAGFNAGSTATSDVEPASSTITAQAAYPYATTHKTGGDLSLGGGPGMTGFTIIDYSQLYGQSVRVVVDDGLPTAAYYLLTEGVQFSAQTSNEVTATNLAAAITAWCPGVEATASGANVGVSKTAGAATLYLESETAYITASNSDPGHIYMVTPCEAMDLMQAHGGVALGAVRWSPLPLETRLYITAPIMRYYSSAAFAPAGFMVGLRLADGLLVLLQFEDGNFNLTKAHFPGLVSDYQSSAGSWLLLAYNAAKGYFEEILRSPMIESDPRLPAAGTAGNILTSNGISWTSAAPPADTDTLATVTARGATTSVATTFSGGLSASSVSSGRLTAQVQDPSTVGAIIKGYSGQTADLLQMQDSTGAIKTSISAIGDIIAHGIGTHSSGDGPIKIVNANNQITFAVGDYIGATEGTLFLWAPAGQGNGSGISLTSGGGAKSGLFELDGGGNMVFRNKNAAGTYFDFNTSGIFFRDHNMTKVMTLSEAGNLNFGSAGDVGFLRSAAGVMKVTDGGSGDGTITAKSFRLKGYTVATLPAGMQGDTAYVTDALNPTYLGVVVGGGTTITPVFFNGTNWVAY
jgi:hypothetical protein